MRYLAQGSHTPYYGKISPLKALWGLLVFGALTFALTAQAATHVASPGGDSITQCIAISAAGDTIDIEAGLYNETVVVDKVLTLIGLQGSSNTTITGPDTDLDVVTVLVSGVEISGLSLDGGRYGLALASTVEDIQLSDCAISETGNAHLQLPPNLVNQVVSAVTLVPHASSQRNTVLVLTGTIDTSTTWHPLPAGFVYYLNASTVTVGGSDSPVLTIGAGTIIKGWRSSFLIGPSTGEPGGLMADNVVFTSVYDDSESSDTSGDDIAPTHSNWYDLRFHAGAIEESCQLTNCDIRYGGRFNPALWARFGGSFTATNCTLLTNGQSVRIEGGGETTMTNCTMAPFGNGISVMEPSTSAGITGCTITQDSGYPVMLPMQMVDSFLNVQGNAFIPRGDGMWDAVGINTSTITESMTLPVLPSSFVYYLISSTITVGGPNSPVLTIPSGFIIKGWRSSFLIGPSTGEPGGLMADNVVFTSVYDDTEGGDTSGDDIAPIHSNWYDLRFHAGAIAESCQLTNCDIRYGGRFNPALWARYGGSFTATNCHLLTNGQSVRIEGGGETTMTNCTMAPFGNGISVMEPSTSAGITGCTITQDSGYPILLPMQMVDSFLNVQGNSFIPRGDGMWDAVGINTSNITESMTLPTLPHDFVYYLSSSTVTVGGPNSPVLTIPSGFIVKGWRSSFLVGPNADNLGGLMANNVVFTSIYDDTMGGDTSGNNTAPTHSNWYDLRFHAGAIAESCQLTNCDIRYGGRFNPALWARFGGSFTATNCTLLTNGQSVRIEGGGEPTMTNCTMAPFGNGISVMEPSTSAGITGCTITQDSGYPILLPMQMVDSFLNVQGNSYIPRGDGMWDAVGINTSNIFESMTLPTLPHNFVYYLSSSTVTVGGPNSPVLTIPSGFIVKGWRSSFLVGPSADNPGGLMADNVVFTSLYDDTEGGDTSGNDTAPTHSNWYDLRFHAGAIAESCQLTNCDIRYGGRFNPVLWARFGGSFTATNCTLLTNGQSVRIEGGGEPTMTNCTMAPFGNGISVMEPSTSAGITGCTVTQDSGYPILLPMQMVDSFLNVQGNSYIPRGDGMWDAVGINTSNITESLTLPTLPHDFVYYLASSTIKVGGPSRPTLTIEPGTILKNYRSSFEIGLGDLNPGGINFQGATFTSLYDDSVGGDTSGNANAPSPGEWYNLVFNSTSSEINCDIIDCDFRYGGRFGNGTIKSLSASSLVLNSSRISHSASAGLLSVGEDSRPRIYYSQFSDNYDGIQSLDNGRPDIVRSCFENNSHLSVNAEEFTDGLGDLYAQECWWGSASGPVVGTDVSEFVDYSNWTTIATCLDLTDVPQLPTDFAAMAPAPNPFNPSTDIRFALPRAESVHLRIFDVRGSLVRELIQGDSFEPGQHSVTWNGRDNTGRSVPSGVYFYALEAGSFNATHKMMLLK